MKIFLTDLIPQIKEFSRRLDDQTLLSQQNWVFVNDIIDVKKVYIFGKKGDIDIYENGFEVASGYKGFTLLIKLPNFTKAL